MVDPTKNRGDAGRPYGPEPEKQDEKIDPEKFKKVMKIDQTDESQKRHQRRLKKEEGDEEDEQIQAPSPPSPATSFAEFIQDKDDLDSVFEKQSSGIQKRTNKTTKESSTYPYPFSSKDQSLEEEPPSEETPSPLEPSLSDEDLLSSPYDEDASPLPSKQDALSSSYPDDEKTPDVINESDENISEYHDEMFGSPSSVLPDENKTSDNYSIDDETSIPSYPDEKVKKDELTPKDQKKEEEDTSLLSSQVKKGALTSKKAKKAKPGPKIEKTSLDEEKTVSAPIKKEEGQKEKEGTKNKKAPLSKKQEEKKSQDKASPLPSRPDTPQEETTSFPLGERDAKEHEKGDSISLKGELPSFKQFSPEEIQKQHLNQSQKSDLDLDHVPTEGMAPLTPAEAEAGMMRHKKKKEEDFPFIDSTSLMAPFITSESPFSPIKAPEEISSYFKLDPQVREFYNQIIGSIIVQEHTGVTSTTITINRPDSIFDGAQITLDRYSTALNSYNLQLTANPAAVDLFNTNLEDLIAAFKQGQYSFEMNILKPSYESKKPLIRRKGSAGGDSGKGKR